MSAPTASTSRVLVAGGGIGGLALANALQQLDIPVTVFEQATELREIGAAIGVQTNAVQALREIGLGDALLDVGVPIEDYEYVDWKGKRLARWSQGEIGRQLGAPTTVVHRGDLQKVLRAPLPDSVVRLDSPVAGFSQDDAGVTLRLADGTEERGALLVGCDGLRSLVRQELLGHTSPRYSGWVALRGIAEDWSHPSFPIGRARQTLGVARSFGTWHIRGDRVYWVATLRAEPGAEDPPEGRKKLVLGAFAGAHEPIADVIEATDDDAILRNEVYDRVPVTGWSKGRVTLLGDAAHPTTPVTGQGGGQAIIDAVVLADALATTDLCDTAAVGWAFATYEDRRRGVTAEITNEAWRIAAMHHFTSRLLCAGRDLSLRLTPARVWNKRMLSRLAY
jgi:2-polyprenyl-6-methoxyphenol hydroxylase-like FAD-dependent oxidoreductase